MEKQLEKMTEKNDKQPLFIRGILSVLRVLLILGLFFYVLYHLTNGFSAELVTETVTMHSRQRVIDSSGMIVRLEKPLENTTGGVVSYRYENGTRVSKGAKVANVYGSSDNAAAVARVAKIDETLDFLKEAGVEKELNVSDGIASGKRLAASFADVADMINRGELGAASVKDDELLRDFLVRSAALEGDKSSIINVQSALESERAKLANSMSGVSSTVTSGVAGYFYDYADGAEDVFDYNNITSLTVQEYKECEKEVLGSSSNAAGKIVTLPKWYFVCPVTKADGASLEKGKTYEVHFGASNMSVQMKLEAKNTAEDESLLVFSSKEISSDFDFTRSQKVSVIADTISGYRVPSSALRVVDGTVGVYIRSGNTVKFRVCDVIYESGTYSYVNPETEGVTLFSLDTDEENDVYCKGLSLYDNVIVSGAKELYPDRIVN